MCSELSQPEVTAPDLKQWRSSKYSTKPGELQPHLGLQVQGSRDTKEKLANQTKLTE